MTRRLLMWSGPRNLSTAMMRSFGSRADCVVMDEPFYGAYLKATGLEHPMRQDILDSMECDPAKVAQQCLHHGAGHALSYQKHMVHHMLDGFPLDFADGAINVFLIREPERVLASYAAKREDVTLDDIGFKQQAALFEAISGASGQRPVVVDSARILADPERMLAKLCTAVGLTPDAAMLTWEPGLHPADGIWASHWYGAVANSTGFAASREKPLPELDPELAEIAQAARPYYEALKAHELT